MKKAAFAAALLFAASLFAQTPPPAAAPAQQPQPNEGQKLVRAGKLDEALAWFQGELKKTPDSVSLNNSAGVVLDLLGRTKEARVHFTRALEAAETPQAKASANRNIAMSYAFDGDCANTWKFQQPVIEHYASTGDAFRQGEMVNEAARICLEAGELDTAEKLYLQGQEAGLKETNISAERMALWKFRTENALARIAARRGNAAAAKKHVAAARAALDSNAAMAKEQEAYFPYLTGYVALHTGDAKTALAELEKANQNDAFVQVLMAQAHEKLGQKDEARALYEKAATTTGHNPTAATARPLAMKKLAKP